MTVTSDLAETPIWQRHGDVIQVRVPVPFPQMGEQLPGERTRRIHAD